jgi:hypoxanthine phosphoribosyltransferase
MTISANLHDDIEQIVITQEQLRRRVQELAQQIAADYHGKPLLLVGVLKGGVVFMTDLFRALDRPVEMDFMAVSSYGDATETTGIVRILKDLDEPIRDKHVLLVEDIVDSGLTLRYIAELLEGRDPASLKVCVLLDKGKAGETGIEVAYLGFTIPDKFVVGYGLDFAQIYRNLPYIGVLKPSVYATPAEGVN